MGILMKTMSDNNSNNHLNNNLINNQQKYSKSDLIIEKANKCNAFKINLREKRKIIMKNNIRENFSVDLWPKHTSFELPFKQVSKCFMLKDINYDPLKKN